MGIRDKLAQAQSGLIPITWELVRELKSNGMSTEARTLVNSFRENCIKQHKQDWVEVKRLIGLKIRFGKISRGECFACKEKSVKGGYCLRHLELRKNSYIRERTKNTVKIQKGLCMLAGCENKQIYHRRCKEHLIGKKTCDICGIRWFRSICDDCRSFTKLARFRFKKKAQQRSNLVFKDMFFCEYCDEYILRMSYRKNIGKKVYDRCSKCGKNYNMVIGRLVGKC